MDRRGPVHSNDEFEAIFADIFKKHEARLYLLAHRLTKSDLYTKDIIQEVFLKLWEHRAELHTIKNIEAWLYKATENKIIDLLRKAAADRRLRDALWNNITRQESQTESQVISKDYNHVMQNAIEKLPPQRKLIYYMNKEEGMSYDEIASQLSISRNTVRNQLADAIQSIRRFFSRNTQFFFFLFL